ncbi:MAG: hypothetical protein HYV77_02165 [Candidatus Wildermuthbacteria bacterium]|nr:hypothetical protein [Candidatus Wildermuthbacteria bacterium]
MKKILVALFILAAAAGFLAPQGAEAQERLIPCGFDENNDGNLDATEACGFCDIFQLINNLIKFFLVPTINGPNNGFAIVPLIATLLFVVGGFFYLVSPTNPSLQTKAKDIMVSVVIGLAIVYSAWVVIDFLLSAFGIVSWQGFDNWWTINC